MKKILLLPGDGIGPEIMEQAKKVLACFPDLFEWEEGLIGGAAIDKFGSPFPKITQEQSMKADAVLLGAVGGPKWDSFPSGNRPENGLLAIRKDLGLFANIRPLDIWKPLIDLSPLKPSSLKDVSFVVVRELTGDLYFGTPRGFHGEKGSRTAFNTMIYSEEEIKRIAHTGFKMARSRKKKLCSIDKSNVLETMVLWREIVEEVHLEYKDVALSHMYVDNAAMQIIKRPSDFDVILTSNMFGDILSDEAAVLCGSLGLLPSASVGIKHALYEPIHGSAPDIAGMGIANPIGMILSVAMMLETSCNSADLAFKIRRAVAKILDAGLRTKDIWSNGMVLASTNEIGDRIAENILG